MRFDESLGSFYLPAFSKMNEDNAGKYMFEQKFIHHADSKVRFYAFANQIFDVYGDNAIIGICFIIVCLFRDIIIRYRREFPSLFLFGPKGTGKTASVNCYRVHSYMVATTQTCAHQQCLVLPSFCLRQKMR